MGSMPDRPSGSDETEDERLDRNLCELLQELRVALPGVQVLFAFLLAVPFQQHFTAITPFEKKVYFATLLCTAVSAALLIAPSAYHRLTFRYQQKEHLVVLANRFAIAGLGFLALAMTGAMMLITDVLFGDGRHRDHRRPRWSCSRCSGTCCRCAAGQPREGGQPPGRSAPRPLS